MSENHEETHMHQSTDHVAQSGEEASHDAATTPAYDDLNTPIIALVGFLSAVITFICVVGLQAAYLQYRAGNESLRYEVGQMPNKLTVRLETVESIQSAQLGKLHSGYNWVNKETGTIGMPIEQAMKVVAEQYESK